MTVFWIYLIQGIASILIWMVIIHSVLSFFMDPFHPVRENLGRIVNPLLAPIRQVMPPMGGLDFSPLVFLLLIQLVRNLLISAFRSFL